MTQYYSYRKFSLPDAPRHVKVLLTTFSVVILVALSVGLINYWDKTGMTVAGVTAWYRGNEGQPVGGGAMIFEKTFREMIDATHPHLFGQGVLLFILSHIVALTALSERKKIALYVFSFAAMLLDAAVPWLIRYVSPGLAPLQLVSIGALTLAFAAQIVVPAREMWFTAAAAPEPAADDGPIFPPRPGESRPQRERPRRDGDRRPRRGGARRPAPAGSPAAAGAGDPAFAMADGPADSPDSPGDAASDDRRSRRRRRWRGRGRPSGGSTSDTPVTSGAGGDGSSRNGGGSSRGGE